jgi:hypothetical protein
MSESQWDKKVTAFLKRTGEDLKKAGTDIKDEAEKLMKDVQSPDGREKVKEGLSSFTKWARKTAEEVAGVVEEGMKKAETAVRTAVDTRPEGARAPSPETQAPPPAPVADEPPASTMSDEASGATTAADEEPLRHDTPVDTPAVSEPAGAAPKKTLGKKKPAAKSKPVAAAKKPLGKKR